VNGGALYAGGTFNTAGGRVSSNIAQWTLCGNCQVDQGEPCDGGDCCSATCQFVSGGSPCSDGNVCTTVDACDGAGTCAGAAPVMCGECQTCDPVNGCVGTC